MPNNSVWDDRSKRWITVDPSAAQNQWNWVQGAIGGSPVTTKPNVPVMPSTSGMYGNVPTSSGAKPLTYTMPDFSSIIKQINDLNLKAQQASNAGRVPNAPALEGKSSGNIDAALSGTLPPDVLRQLGDKYATNAVATGTVGSQAANAAYMRALGLNSLDLQNMGQGWLNNAYARNPGAPVSTIDPSTLYASVGQQLQSDLALRNLEMQQQELAQRYDLAMRQMANNLEAARLQHQGNARTSPYSGGDFQNAPNQTGNKYIYTGGGTTTGKANPNAVAKSSSSFGGVPLMVGYDTTAPNYQSWQMGGTPPSLSYDLPTTGDFWTNYYDAGNPATPPIGESIFGNTPGVGYDLGGLSMGNLYPYDQTAGGMNYDSLFSNVPSWMGYY